MGQDPRKIPYLLVWKNRDDGTLQEAVRIPPNSEIEGLGELDWTGAVEIKRHDGTRNFIRTVVRPLRETGEEFDFSLAPTATYRAGGLYS